MAAAQHNVKSEKDTLAKQAEMILRHARQSQSKNRIDAMIALASTNPLLAQSESSFDARDMLFATQNKVIDLLNQSEITPSADHFISKTGGCDHDDQATCPTWMRFLHEVQPQQEVRTWLQKFVGYCMTGKTDEQMFVVFHGLGANGKSVFVETVKKVMGEYATQAQFSTFCQSAQSESIRNDLARLNKIRLVVATEGVDSAVLDEGIVKQITGGDEIAARFLHKEFFTFKPKFKLILVTNHKPAIKGTDNGIWRRVVLVPWFVTVQKENMDKSLSFKLEHELSGILNWALDGLNLYLKEGLDLPDSIKVANAQYRDESDVVGNWIAEQVEIGKEFEIDNKTLYKNYNNWATENGHRALSQKTLSEKLVERGFVKKRKNAGSWWLGLTVK
jgi:putative DNA primase/helicase